MRRAHTARSHDGALHAAQTFSASCHGRGRQKQQLAQELRVPTETLRLNEMFAAVLGHDLRSFLSALLAAAYEIQKRCDDPFVHEAGARMVVLDGMRSDWVASGQQRPQTVIGEGVCHVPRFGPAVLRSRERPRRPIGPLVGLVRRRAGHTQGTCATEVAPGSSDAGRMAAHPANCTQVARTLQIPQNPAYPARGTYRE